MLVYLSGLQANLIIRNYLFRCLTVAFWIQIQINDSLSPERKFFSHLCYRHHIYIHHLKKINK